MGKPIRWLTGHNGGRYYLTESGNRVYESTWLKRQEALEARKQWTRSKTRTPSDDEWSEDDESSEENSGDKRTRRPGRRRASPPAVPIRRRQSQRRATATEIPIRRGSVSPDVKRHRRREKKESGLFSRWRQGGTSNKSDKPIVWHTSKRPVRYFIDSSGKRVYETEWKVGDSRRHTRTTHSGSDDGTHSNKTERNRHRRRSRRHETHEGHRERRRERSKTPHLFSRYRKSEGTATVRDAAQYLKSKRR